jgi:hypothetical protein
MLDATDTTKQRQTAQTEALADTLSDLLDGNKRALTQWLHGTQAFTDEVLRISRSRTLLAIEAWSALLACRSPEQMGEQQRRFLAKALEQSAEELKTLSQLAMKPPSDVLPK